MDNYTQIQFVDTFGQTGPHGVIDVDVDSQFSIDFSVINIKDPFSRKGVKSYNFKIAGNKVVNQMLNNYYEVNSVDGTYNHNLKQKVIVLRNGVIILDNAYMRLININKLPSMDQYGDQMISYDVTVGDDATAFFTDITNKFLTEIDFSDMDHTYTAANVVASFPNSAIRDNALNTGGYKYVLPWTSEKVYKLEECRPAISLYEYFNRIHGGAGYTWEWEGFDTNKIRMDKLWIPYNGDTPKMHDQEQYEVAAEITTPFTKSGYDWGATYPEDILSTNFICDTEIIDSLGLYDPITGEYTSNINTGTGTIEATFEVEYELIITNPTGGDLYLTNGSLAAPIADYGWKYRSYIWIKNETSGIYSQQASFKEDLILTTPSAYYTLPAGDTVISSGTVRTPVLPVTDIQFGDVLKTYIGSDAEFEGVNWFRSATTGTGGSQPVHTRLEIASIKMIILPRLDTYGYNTNLVMNDFVPNKIKQSDFIKGVANFYNLIIYPDSVNERKIIYKLRDDYYDEGGAKDWTKKLCLDKDQSISFISDSNAKKVILSYTPDNDSANKDYLAETKEVYGQLEYTLENDNIKGYENKEVVFSPTPIAYTSFGTYNPLWPAQAPNVNIRILLDGGVQDTLEPYNIIDTVVPEWSPYLPDVNGLFTGTGASTGYSGSASSGVLFVSGTHAGTGATGILVQGEIDTYPGITFTALVSGVISGGVFTGSGNIQMASSLPAVVTGELGLTEYPMLTHLDNPDNPVFDINFGLCDQYMFPFTTTTNNNLYSMFWRRTIGQIDKGKLLSAYFQLNEYDISILKLNDKIFVKDTWYNISSLNYDPNSLGVTKVVLMTIDDFLAAGYKVAKRVSKSSSGSISTSKTLREVSKKNIDALNWNYADDSVVIQGKGNTVLSDVKNAAILGNNNSSIIKSGSEYIENLNVKNLLLNGQKIESLGIWSVVNGNVMLMPITFGSFPSVIPFADEQSDLGADGLAWKDLYVNGIIKAVSALVIDGSSKLDLKADAVSLIGDVAVGGTTSTFTIPKLTTTQIGALTPSNGMLVYDTTTNKFQGYEAGAWTNLI